MLEWGLRWTNENGRRGWGGGGDRRWGLDEVWGWGRRTHATGVEMDVWGVGWGRGGRVREWGKRRSGVEIGME